MVINTNNIYEKNRILVLEMIPKIAVIIISITNDLSGFWRETEELCIEGSASDYLEDQVAQKGFPVH